MWERAWGKTALFLNYVLSGSHWKDTVEVRGLISLRVDQVWPPEETWERLRLAGDGWGLEWEQRDRGSGLPPHSCCLILGK